MNTVGSVWDWLGRDARSIDKREAEKYFKVDFPILLQNEEVEIVFKCGRDFTVFTNRRVLRVDVKGITGNKIEFLSIRYEAIHGYSVITASKMLNRDTEMVLHLPKLGWHHTIKQDFRKSKSNLWAVQMVLSNHILGEDKHPLSGTAQYQNDPLKALQIVMSQLTDKLRPIDTNMIERTFRADPPILQGSEHVEMAFQGRTKHITLFTTKRVISIHREHLLSSKMEYTSIPWNRFVAFSIETANHVDFDTELHLYTELHFEPGDEYVPAQPKESCLQLDFSKIAVDIYKLKYYVSRRIIDFHKEDMGSPISMRALTEDPNALNKLARLVESDQRELDPDKLDREFHSSAQILLDGEKILMVFKGGRHISLFTNKRVMTIDMQGLTRSKMLYRSIPYKSIRGYAVESAGTFDRDSEVIIYTRNRWHLWHLRMDFRSGKTDVMMLQKLLSGFIVGRPTDSTLIFGPKNYHKHKTNIFGGFGKNFTGGLHCKEVSASEMNDKYHSEINMLLGDETVLRAFADGRDAYLYTSRRLIYIDTKGLSGKRVIYLSIPYRSMQGFIYETAGNMDRDAEMYIYTHKAHLISSTNPRSVNLWHEKQRILVKNTDIHEVGKLILDHTVFDNTLAEEGTVVPIVEINY